MRIAGIELDEVPEELQATVESQRRKWGAPLANHLVYARCPEIHRGALGMWQGLDRSGHIEGALSALVNRRVAILNKCYF